MTNIHIRGLDKQMVQQLKHKADQQRTSVNTLIINIIQQELGLKPRAKKVTYHDLDKLAGTWNAADTKAFTKSISDFEVVDKELWK